MEIYYMSRTIGILALQGDFEKHGAALKKAGAGVKEIRIPEQLKGCDGLVIPGGESTTLTILMKRYGFYEALKQFAVNYPIMGTCAGLIMLSSEVDDNRVEPLRLINISTSRNAYGRQVDSFIAPIEFNGLKNKSFNAYFIRAPKVIKTGKEVNVLANYKDSPIAVINDNILAVSFHPELGTDIRIHKYFIDL
jgi:pyridoxal 5'-phosphate synthase pdxT subunit